MTIQKKKVHMEIDPHLEILIRSLTRKTFMANRDYQKLFTSLSCQRSQRRRAISQVYDTQNSR